MTDRRDLDNRLFVGRVQRRLGIRPDEWAGGETVAAWEAWTAEYVPEQPFPRPGIGSLTVAVPLRAVAPRLVDSEVADWSEHLAAAAERWGITTINRLAAWLPQLAHESTGFSRLEENLNYTSAKRLLAIFPSAFASVGDAGFFVRNPMALAERVYGFQSRKGKQLGNTEPGDGFAYRGGGLVMLTGEDNYRQAERATGLPLVEHPEILRRVGEPAATVAGWYWQSRGCNELADAGDFRQITRAIAGGLTGLADRERLWALAKAALGVEP